MKDQHFSNFLKPCINEEILKKIQSIQLKSIFIN